MHAVCGHHGGALPAAELLLVDDLHAYSRVTLGEYYAQADAVDTAICGFSHSYRSFDPDTIDPILGSHSFNLGTSQQQDGSYWLIREAATQPAEKPSIWKPSIPAIISKNPAMFRWPAT